MAPAADTQCYRRSLGTFASPAGSANARHLRENPYRKESQMKHKLILAAAVSLAMASSAMAQTSSGTSDTTSGAASGSSDSTSASPGMLQMTEAEKSTTANWSGPIADAFFKDSTMTSLKTGAEIKSAWSSLTPEQQAQVEQDCNTMQTASTGTTTPTTGSGSGTSTDTTASASGTTGTTSGRTGTGGTSTDTTARASGTTGTTGTTAGTTGTSGESTASTTTGTSGTTGAAVSDPMTIAQLCDMVGSM